MKFQSSLVIVLLLGFLWYESSSLKVQNYEEKESLILQGVDKIIDYAHYNPKELDDEFSKYLFDEYLKRLDGGKRFFTMEEINQLKPFESSLDEQVKVGSFQFFDQSLLLYEKSIERARDIMKEMEAAEFDFNKNEELEFDFDKRAFAQNPAELKDFWRKLFKYEIMTKYLALKEESEKGEAPSEVEDLSYVEDEVINTDTKKKDQAQTAKSDEELMKEAREKVNKNFEDWFHRIDKLRREDRFQAYMGAIANYYDPHTDYFSPKEKEDFDINMGGKLEGIGARLQTDGEYTKVVSIVPGGPAYQDKELEVNDIIYKVRQEGEEEATDISGMRIDDVVQKIRGKKGTVVILTVKKEDGTFKDVSIERDEVILDEGFARSVIVDFPGLMNNVGLIKLPKFYSSFEKEDGNSCAEDVALEIEKLKSANVNGIILDLRNNTGGSLQDVVKMTGLFIEDGPIVQVKSREGKPYLHKDTDKSVAYDGPLIVMVNNLSASASEIIAAALQDYNRALIVGSKSTFGKGTVQRFFDLDDALRGYDDKKPLGNVKITVQKFFRVNGGSTQMKGVIPDIILPDSYQYIDIGEKEYKTAMPYSEIAPVAYHQNVVSLNNIDKLQKLSENRIANNENFVLVLENASRLKKNKDITKYSLNIETFKNDLDQKEKEAEKFENLFDQKIEKMHFTNLAVDTSYINADKSRIDRNNDWIDHLQKDFYLQETLNIMRDMIDNEASFAGIEKKLDVRKVE
ncbi:MAG TPA: carboxy terminal-processing peptidase [Saprospiraceae bacterium]|nr:carboxy terminal-processing peptidase [Saprospiraceae bacterium]MCB9328997.1 carboxy terminal-processing peptidase [Lewinellaceae bacterium]HRX29164.1 carboxy terminal-processing peptidase [Saprospiraceae bacterium]